jgi:hypothetical protein
VLPDMGQIEKEREEANEWALMFIGYELLYKILQRKETVQYYVAMFLFCESEGFQMSFFIFAAFVLFHLNVILFYRRGSDGTWRPICSHRISGSEHCR